MCFLAALQRQAGLCCVRRLAGTLGFLIFCAEEEKIHPSTLRGIVRFQHNNSHDMPSPDYNTQTCRSATTKAGAGDGGCQRARRRTTSSLRCRYSSTILRLLTARTKVPHLAEPAPEPVCTVDWRRALPGEASLQCDTNLCSWTNMKQGTIALGWTSTRSPRTTGPNPSGHAQKITLPPKAGGGNFRLGCMCAVTQLARATLAEVYFDALWPRPKHFVLAAARHHRRAVAAAQQLAAQQLAAQQLAAQQLAAQPREFVAQAGNRGLACPSYLLGLFFPVDR